MKVPRTMTSKHGILMPEFYRSVPAFLLGMVPAFRASPEFRTVFPDYLDLPGVVAGAFARFLERRFLESLEDAKEPVEVSQGFHAIECLSDFEETMVQNLVVTEIFENLQMPDKMRARFENRLGRKAKKLFRNTG